VEFEKKPLICFNSKLLNDNLQFEAKTKAFLELDRSRSSLDLYYIYRIEKCITFQIVARLREEIYRALSASPSSTRLHPSRRSGIARWTSRAPSAPSPLIAAHRTMTCGSHPTSHTQRHASPEPAQADEPKL
jgi:hypothetical protein